MLDAASVQEVMRLHPDGARLVLRSEGGEGYNVLACSIGFQWCRTPVFAYVETLADGPPFWAEARVFVEGLTLRGGAWVIDCRDERGIREIEVQGLPDEERAAVRGRLESMPAEVLDDMESAMRAMLDPRAL